MFHKSTYDIVNRGKKSNIIWKVDCPLQSIQPEGAYIAIDEITNLLHFSLHYESVELIRFTKWKNNMNCIARTEVILEIFLLFEHF